MRRKSQIHCLSAESAHQMRGEGGSYEGKKIFSLKNYNTKFCCAKIFIEISF